MEFDHPSASRVELEDFREGICLNERANAWHAGGLRFDPQHFHIKGS